MYYIKNEDDVKYIRITQKIISNKLNSINGLKEFENIKESIQYCCDQFAKYWDFISEHIDNYDYLSKSSIELHNYMANIDSKIDKIQIDLYK